MPQISVIVPVYKVEEYLAPCVDSILAQSFQDYELILTDDGSPDSCGAICDKYAEKDDRIKVIHQENQGLSGARNSGMDIAAGSFITFIDSDDMIGRDYLDTLLRYALREGADIVTSLFVEFEKPKDIFPENVMKEKEVTCNCYDNIGACIKLYNGDSDILVNACGKLFRTELIKDLRFPIGRLHEDQAFVPVACYRSGKMATVDRKMYYYRIRSASITKDTFSVKRYDDVWALDKCIAFFESKGEESILEAAVRRRKRLLAVYAIYAKRDDVSVPVQYRTGIVKALIYLRRNVSSQRYQYYLAQLYPKLARIDEYLRKLEKIFRQVK